MKYAQKGFTLIEILVVVSITAILGVVSIASFTSYSDNRTLESATDDVVSILNTAKSRSLSQVKPAACGTQTLQGYRVLITIPGPTYDLLVVCGTNTYLVERKKLPNKVTFMTGSTTTISFRVLNGSANPGTITLSGFGKTNAVQIDVTGNVREN